MIEAVKDIVKQLDKMAYLNIISFSVLSGSGTSVSPSDHDLDAIEELSKDMPPNQRPYNVMFMNSLYKKSMPIYANEIANPYDFEGYLWLNKKRSEIIDINVMACSIINCCRIIEKLYTNQIQLENNQLVAYILFRTALYQARFIKKHLKVGELYYSGENITSQDEKEPRIQIAPKNPDRISQFSVLQSFSMLRRIAAYNLQYMDIKGDEFEEDIEMLSHLCSNVLAHISDIKSRELANIGLCLVGIYTNSDSQNKTAYKALEIISAELIKRTGESGEISRNTVDPEASSAATLSNCLNLLAQVSYMFGRKDCYNACTKIFSKLSVHWDHKHRTYVLKDSNKQSFSIKDISAIISALLSFYPIADAKLSDKIKEQIEGFYETAFVNSQILTGQRKPILQQDTLELPSSIAAVEGAVPVFNKAFEYKVSKNKFYCDADIFRGDYVLPSCCLLLNNISSCCI